MKAEPDRSESQNALVNRTRSLVAAAALETVSLLVWPAIGLGGFNAFQASGFAFKGLATMVALWSLVSGLRIYLDARLFRVLAESSVTDFDRAMEMVFERLCPPRGRTVEERWRGTKGLIRQFAVSLLISAALAFYL